MFSLTLIALSVAAVPSSWHTDYDRATWQAQREKKDLVIYFRDQGELDDVLKEDEVQRRLSRFVCLRLPISYKYKDERLLDHSEVISAHPYVGSRYRWVPGYGTEELVTILDLPPTATLTQRSMIYAVRVHPERPRSILARLHPAFLRHAERHSQRQARLRNQHHADIIAASSRLQEEVGDGIGPASEVVAESWGSFVGGETVLEAAFSCVDSWRHSSGHWGAVSRTHRYTGFDIARAENGTWYATGIFAD